MMMFAMMLIMVMLATILMTMLVLSDFNYLSLTCFSLTILPLLPHHLYMDMKRQMLHVFHVHVIYFKFWYIMLLCWIFNLHESSHWISFFLQIVIAKTLLMMFLFFPCCNYKMFIHNDCFTNCDCKNVHNDISYFVNCNCKNCLYIYGLFGMYIVIIEMLMIFIF
jgi:hypothetical protein